MKTKNHQRIFFKPPAKAGGYSRGHRGSVSAESYGEWNKKKAFEPPVIPKSDEQTERLKQTLSKSFLFASLEDKDFAIVIGAMKEKKLAVKQRIIQQGDDGDFLCVIESGKFSCLIKLPDGTEKNVKTCGAGDVFGELALLYNCPRAASVEASEDSVAWQLDRETFNNIVKEAAQKKRERYDAFLAKVPLLKDMESYERSQLSDALQTLSLEAGAEVVKQGDDGHKFFIVEEGDAEVIKSGESVKSLVAGDYFGELALIKSQPRAATVKCKTACKLLWVDDVTFNRLLNVEALIKNAEKYA